MINKDIFITEPNLPPIDECLPDIVKLWDSKVLTNNGPYLQEFEKKLGDFLNVKHVSVVNNATTGLMIAQRALNFQGEVITSPFSFVATAHSISWMGLKPIFVDTDRLYGNIDVQKIEHAITQDTGGILATHNFGYPSEIEELTEIAQKFRVPLVFDAAPAIGVKYKGRSITANGDASVLSFHATKIFTTFEGGAIISKNSQIKERVDLIRNFNIRNFNEMGGLGTNGKMSELNALIGLKGLKYIDESIKNRKFRYQLYCNLLSDVENLSIPNIKDEWEYNYSYFPIFMRKGNKHREIIFNELANNSIYCRKYWSPLITKHDLYSQNKYDLNNANELSNQVLALPMGNNVTVSIINFICSIIKRSINA